MEHNVVGWGRFARVLAGFFVAVGVSCLSQDTRPVVPAGIIPVPEEPGIAVTLRTDRAVYAPRDTLQLTFTLSRPAYVYLYNLTSDGRVKLLVPNRFLQDPRFPSGEHALPTTGWILRVTEPEGIEYLQLLATEQPLSFYDAKAFENEAFLVFADPASFSARLQGVLAGAWGTAWTRFRVHRPRAALTVNTIPSVASVWADGRYLGTSPLSTIVSPGVLRIRVEKGGYETRSLDLTVGDGEEVSLAVTLSRARPPLWPRVGPFPRDPTEPLPPVGLGLAAGLDSVATDLWFGGLGLGVSLRTAPPRPDLAAPGLGRQFPWGPELEAYIAAWLPVDRAGGLILAGISAQEMAWIPAWSLTAAVVPKVDVEPETETEFQFTWGVGLGVGESWWRAYLLWHSRRGVVVGFVFGPQ